MARTINGTAGFQVQITDNDANGFTTSHAGFTLGYMLAMVSGLGTTEPTELNEVFANERGLAASAVEELDLNGVLVGGHGYTVQFAKVKGLFVALPNLAVQSSGLLVGGAAAGAFASWLGGAPDKARVAKGGFFVTSSGVDVAGFAVGANDKLKIENADAVNAATYQIVIWGNK